MQLLGSLAQVLCVLSACLVATKATDLDTNLLRQNHDGPTNEGTLFVVAFTNNAPNADSMSRAILYVMNRNSTPAIVQVSLPHNPSFPGYPQTISIGPNSKRDFVFSTTAPNDIRLTSDRDRIRGISVRVMNNIPVTVVGSNSESKSTDAFLVLPCQTVTSNEYKYFLFSSGREAAGTQTAQFAVVACEDTTTVTYSGSTTAIQLEATQTYSLTQNFDFTGNSITSNKPVAVFSGHQCGRIPMDKSACDHLVEQIPMHAVWGNTFFTSPFGYRGSGEIYRVGSLLDANVITTTCTRRSGSSAPVTTTSSTPINAGRYHQFQTESSPVGVALTNYRREFCCIETSKPAIVMQYMPGHSLDETNVGIIGSGIGDPAMSIIPPVEQYRNSFISTTITVGSDETFTNLITWTVPAEFISPPVTNEVFLDGRALNPGMLQGGTGDYIPISCSNGEVCGYGAISPLSVMSGSSFKLEFNSSKDAYAGASFNVYGYVAEMSYAYPAGFEMEPIGLPRITVYSVTVPENIGSVTIPFNRTGGDLSINSRIFALNRDVPGEAVEGADYTLTTALHSSGFVRIRFRRNEVNPPATDPPFTLSIIDDEVDERDEYFEVFFNVDVNGYPFPGVARVTIVDNDGTTTTTPNVQFDPTTYSVTEGQTTGVTLRLSSASSSTVTAIVTSSDGTALAGSDYTTISSRTVTFPPNQLTATLPNVVSIGDNINELTENFELTITSASGATVGSNDKATINIIDDDSLSVQFNPVTYTVLEGGNVNFMAELNRRADRQVTVAFGTTDGTATSGVSNNDYTATSTIFTFPSLTTRLSQAVATAADGIADNGETFTATLSNPTNGLTLGSASTATATIQDPIVVSFVPATYTVSEGDGTATLVVELNRPSTTVLNVDFETKTGTATATDFISTTNTVTFPAGSTRQTFTVPIRNDNINELTESFTAELASAPEYQLGTSVATVTITDDDELSVQFNPAAYTVLEGGNVNFMAELNREADRQVTVAFGTTDGTATSGVSNNDYTATSTIFTFPSRTTRLSQAVATTADGIADNGETFTATLSNPTNGLTLGSASTATATIQDAIVVSFVPAAYTVSEGDGTANLMVVLNRPSTTVINVGLSTSTGTATATDFTNTPTTVTFPVGSTSQTVMVPILNDNINELTESFTAELASGPEYQLGTSTATVTINDDDELVFTITPAAVSINEGGTGDLTVELSVPADREVGVTVTSGGGTATSGNDYRPISDQITFQPGATDQIIEFVTIEDTEDEPNETFEVTLTNPTSGTLGASDSSTVTILDNDNPISVRFERSEYTANEGTSAGLTVILSRSPTSPVVVTVVTVQGTATANSDYTPVTRTLTFPAGESRTMTLPVSILGDGINDPGEVLTAELRNPSGAVLGSPSTATINIVDTNPVNVQFNPVAYTISEGSSGEVMAVLNVPSTRDLTVEFDTMMGTAGTDDYTVVRETLTFRAGTTSVPVTVTVTDDNTGEPSEMFTAVLSSPSSGLVLGPQDTATITIPENDTPTLQFNPDTYTGTEGDTENLMIVLSNPSSTEVTVLVTTTDGTATGGEDYPIISTRVTFAPGTTTRSVPVNLMEDTVQEQPEDFTATISSPTGGATLGSSTTATVTIMEDDMLLVNFNPSTYAVNEGGSTNLMVMLNSPADRVVTVMVTTEPVTADVADYTSVTMTLTFPIGQTTAMVSVMTTQDDIQEGTERFRAVLSNPTNGLGIGSAGSATVAINDDDVVNVQFDPTTYTVTEGEGPASVVVVLTKTSAERVFVDIETMSGTAQAPSDYTTVTRTLTFEPNTMQQTVSIGVADDNLNEDEESFTVMLSNPRGAQLGSDDTATVTVQDDDPLEIEFDPDEYFGFEGDSVNLIISLNRPADRIITVDLTTVDNTATSPSDYSATTVTVTFPAGETTAMQPIRLIDDGVNEDLEDFSARLTNPSGGATISVGTAAVGVQDRNLINFNPVTYSIDEGDSGTLTLELTNPPTSEVTVDVTLNPGTATTSDYESAPRTVTVTFPAGQTTQTVTVRTREDSISEGPEVFTATLSNPVGGGFAIGPDDTATITINDDDSLTVNFDPTTYTVAEGDDEDIMVVLSNPSSSPVTVGVVTVIGSADGADFTEFVRTVTFQPTETTVSTRVVTIDDERNEPNEVFSVLLRNPVGANLGPNSRAEVTIADNDVVDVEFNPTSYTVTEGEDAVITVVTDRPSDMDVIVTVRPVDGSATSPDDFTSSDIFVTFSSGQRTRVVTIPIVDDNTAEVTEMFNAILVSPSDNARVGSRNTATVEINDNDGIVINFEEPDYEVVENEDTVEVCITINRPADRKLCINGSITAVTAQEISDYMGRRLMFNISAGNTRACEEIDIVDDSTVEGRETFRVVLDPPVTPINARHGDDSTTEVTIIDDDSFSANFEEQNYRVRENETSVEVCVTLSNPSSDRITVTANTIPGTAEAGEDFESSTIVFMFGPNEQRACSRVPIVDNDVMEPTEMFRIMINTPTDPNGPAPGPRSTTNVTIEDDDSVMISFVDDDPVVSENSSNVVICIRKIGRSDEDITLVVRAMESSPPDARDGEDFEATTSSLTIGSSESMACITVPIRDDDIAMEPDRRFTLIVDPPPGVTPPRLRGRVTVRDNDVVCVSWERSEVLVSENSGNFMECFTTDRPSFTGFPVRITTQGITDNPATFGADYRTISQDFTVQVASGPGGRYCVNVSIIDDRVADEGIETFTLSISDLPLGARLCSGPDVAIAINDTDNVVVEFKTPDEEVPESAGNAMVCLTRNAFTEEPMTVEVQTSFGSATDEDFELVTKDVVFQPNELEACFEVPIKNDNNPEPREAFSLRIVPQTPGQPTATATVTIIDDDTPRTSACVIQNTLRVSPFNSGPSYQYRGTCEVTALQSCNGSRPDFAVRADYLSDTFDLGAIGILKDGFVWTIREDRNVQTSSTETPTVSGSTSTYQQSDVTITRNTDNITLFVGDGIDIDITRSFVDGTITIEVSSGSSLLQTCGICGTQQGQLLSLDGRVTAMDASMAAKQAFVATYRVPARNQLLRPVRPECAIIRNDTVIGDPLYTVPFGIDNLNLCYEIHGAPNTTYNLITDDCVSVNAYYSPVRDLNIISSIGIRAEGNSKTCRNIRVDLDNCAAFANPMGGGSLGQVRNILEEDGISVRPFSDRVRIVVPRCNKLRLVMWVICEPENTRHSIPASIRFHVSRGVNLNPSAHGLLGQFWNIPITVTQLSSSVYNVTVEPVDSVPRYIKGDLFERTWDNTKEPCIYMGDGQGSSAREDPRLDDSVIEGKYQNYQVNNLFATSFGFSRWESDCTAN